MKLKIFLVTNMALLLMLQISVRGQIQKPGIPPSFNVATLKSNIVVPEVKLKKMNIEKLLQEDEAFPTPLRYAIHENVNIDLKKNGHVTNLASGKIYRYHIASENAKSINLLFRNFKIPAGAELYIYNSEKDLIYGAFTSLNNKPYEQLAVADFPSNNCTVEYYEPDDVAFQGKVIIGSIGKAYRDVIGFLNGSSNLQFTSDVDVNCPVGDEYQLEKHSICRMTFKEGTSNVLCTGALINNTKFNGIPYFLTANHCISSDTVAQTMVTYFNYEREQCGENTIAALNKTISGASLRATRNASDFTLLELSETPDASYQPYYAGWSIIDEAPGNSYSIHHPSGQVKEIAIELDSARSYPIQITWPEDEVSPPDSHWEVSFDVGSTQGGSSGSPLFNQDNKIMGQLHGGSNGVDYYGKLSKSWDDLFTTRALKFWLDPDDTGVTELDGYTPNGVIPDAHFSSNLKNACFAAPVRFTDKSAFAPDSWEWEISSNSAYFVNGTNASSQNPVISFNTSGEYTITLTVTNEFGKNTQTFKNFISVNEQINIGYLISSERRICYNSFTNYEIIAHGAELYQWSVIPDSISNYINLSKNNERLVISRKSSNEIDSSFNAFIVLIGSHGWCADATVIDLSFVYPFNDFIENAHELKFGLNGPFSNKCAGIQNNEPVPPFGDCNSQTAWCDEYSTGENIVENSIWFTFTGPGSGVAGIETRGFDNQIAVYEADQFEDIISGNDLLYDVIAANDDYNPDDYSATIEEINVTPGKTYWVQADGSGGGEEGLFTINLKDSPFSTSIEPNAVAENFRIYPNPATDELFISTQAKFPELQGLMTVAITSTDGKIVYRDDIQYNQETIQVDLSGFEPGLYVIQLHNSQINYTGKVLIR